MMLRKYALIPGILLVLCTLCDGFFGHAVAHELQPGSLKVRQLTTERYEVIWRAPIYYGNTHPARLQLPKHWQNVGEPTIRRLADSDLNRRVVNVPDGVIDGSMIHFQGLEATITEVFVHFIWLDDSESTVIVRPNQPWVEIVAQRSPWRLAWDYTVLGVDHILFGFDHLTFVLALLLIVNGARRLLITVTTFTLAHSITLAAATLGVMWVPGPPVEAAIALSILFLASEMVKINNGESSLTARYPWIIAFLFGLLHGFGFAGALSNVGLPQHEIPLALLMFNIGVELGQLAFITVILILVMLLSKVQFRWSTLMHHLSAYGIGGIAAFWFIQRIIGF